MEEKKNIFDTEDLSGNYDTADIEQNKAMAAIGYIPVLFLIPMLATQSPYAKFHANQGLILTGLAMIVNIGLSILLSIISAILTVITSIIGLSSVLISTITGIVMFVANLVVLILIIIGICNAVTGKAKKLPVIGNLINVIH